MNNEIYLTLDQLSEILECIAFKIYKNEYRYFRDGDRITIFKDGSSSLIFDKKAGDPESIIRIYNSEKIVGTLISVSAVISDYKSNISEELNEEISRLVNSYRREEILKNIQKILP